MNSELPVSADALLAERARLEEELQSSEDWRELLRLKSRKDRGEPMSAVNTARLELVLIDALSLDPTFVRYKAVCVALERLIRGLPPFPTEKTAEARADDDLTQIQGITPSMARRLKALDVTSFAQIAAWSGNDIQYITAELDIGKQIKKQRWVAQAQRLVAAAEAASGLEDDDADEDLEEEDVAPQPVSLRDVSRERRDQPPREPAVVERSRPPAGNAKIHAVGRSLRVESEAGMADEGRRPSPAEAPAPAAKSEKAAVVARHETDAPHDVPPALEGAADAAGDEFDDLDEEIAEAKRDALEAHEPAPLLREAFGNVTPLVPTVKAPDPERPVVPPPNPKPVYTYPPPPVPEAPPPQPVEAPSVPSEPTFDASKLKPPRPLVVTRESIAHLPRHEAPPSPSLSERLASAADHEAVPPAAEKAVDVAREAPVQNEPPAVVAERAKEAPQSADASMSIAEAIAYAAEVARQGEKVTAPEPAKAEAKQPEPPPAPRPPPARTAPPSTVRYEPPRASKASPPPAPRRASPPPPAVNGAARPPVMPPPLPAEFVAQGLPESDAVASPDENGSDLGFSKVEIEEATVEIVRKGGDAAPPPRMIIRPAELDAPVEAAKAATPIGRFLKALTGNQS